MRTHKQLLYFILLTCGMISHIVTVVGPDSSPAEVPGMHVYKVIGAVNGDSKPNIKVTTDMHNILQEYVGTSEIVQDPMVLYEVLKQLEEKVKALSVEEIEYAFCFEYSEPNIMVLADLTLQLVRAQKRCIINLMRPSPQRYYIMGRYVSSYNLSFTFYKGINEPDYLLHNKNENRFSILAFIYHESFRCPPGRDPEMHKKNVIRCPDLYGAHVKFFLYQISSQWGSQWDEEMKDKDILFDVKGDDTSVYPLFETVYWTYILLSQAVFKATKPDEITSILTKNLIIPYPSLYLNHES